MKLGVLKESHPDESRVAASPDSVKKLKAMGFEVTVETGAGARSGFSDDSYAAEGASIANSGADAARDARAVLCVRRPDGEVAGAMSAGSALLGMLAPYAQPEELHPFRDGKIEMFAMELMPRISRAQSMDVLSSQSNLAGYKCVLEATASFGRALPMMMTAAGTIAPAKVFILGVGVAGLQAIATARRLGAVVSATDVRAATKEQVESLGAKFVMVEPDADDSGETAGGYAKEMSDDYKRRQAELVSATVAKQDIVITTALIPGRPAPVLVTQDMVESMRPGSVVVDLAVEQGGNCPLSRVNEIIDHNGVKIVGHANMAGRLPTDASSLYARNLVNFLTTFVDSEAKTLIFDWEDELVTGTALSRDGSFVHSMFSA